MCDDEVSLIERAQGGDRSAYGALYHRHQPTIFQYFYYRLGDAYAAEELTADVFVRMVRHLDSYRPRGRPLLAWLYTMARNLLTDQHRRRKATDTVPLSESLPARSGDPAVELDRRLEAARLARACRRLTEGQRMVVVGRFVEGRTITEMAALLQLSEGAVKSLQHRALASLRRALEKE